MTDPAPIWQQSESRDTISLIPWNDYLTIATRDHRGSGPFALLNRDQVEELRDALTAWLDAEATA